MAISESKTIVRAVVPKSVATTIGRMAQVTGKSRSAVIAEFLTEAEPAIRRLCGMMEVAKSQRALFPRATVAELEAALDDMSGNATDVLDRVHRALQLPLEGSSKGAVSRSRRGSVATAVRAASRRRKTPA